MKSSVILIITTFFYFGCTSIHLAPPDIEKTKYDKFPTIEQQFTYDNYMLGRLKYYTPDKDVDLISIAFIDQRNQPNEKLDESERQILKLAREKRKLYFLVGWPKYDIDRGRKVTTKNLYEGTPTNNPLDFTYIPDQRRWQAIRGCYLKFEDARQGLLQYRQETKRLQAFESKNKETKKIQQEKRPSSWGIVEVDFSFLTYGKPIQITRAWQAYGNGPLKFMEMAIINYQIKSQVCKLLHHEFRIMYVK